MTRATERREASGETGMRRRDFNRSDLGWVNSDGTAGSCQPRRRGRARSLSSIDACSQKLERELHPCPGHGYGTPDFNTLGYQADGRRAGLKIRWCAGEEVAGNIRSFGTPMPSPPTARAAAPSSMSTPLPTTNRRRRPSDPITTAIKSTSTRSSESGFEGWPCRFLTGPGKKERDRVGPACRSRHRSM